MTVAYLPRITITGPRLLRSVLRHLFRMRGQVEQVALQVAGVSDGTAGVVIIGWGFLGAC